VHGRKTLDAQLRKLKHRQLFPSSSPDPFSFAAFCEHRCVSVQLHAYLLWSPRSGGATQSTVRRSPDLHKLWSQNRWPSNTSPMNMRRTMYPESRRKFCKGRGYLRSSYWFLRSANHFLRSANHQRLKLLRSGNHRRLKTPSTLCCSPDLHKMWSHNKRPGKESPMYYSCTMYLSSRRKFCKGPEYPLSTYYFLRLPNRCLLLSSSLHPFSFAALCEYRCVSVQLHAYLRHAYGIQ